MSALLCLPIRAANGDPLVYKFYTHGPEARRFIMFMPGGNYGPDAPMLYYPRELLIAQGWDTLDIQFGQQQGTQAIKQPHLDEPTYYSARRSAL